MKTIEDVEGAKYKLYSDRLEEDHEVPYILPFSALRDAIKHPLNVAVGKLDTGYKTVVSRWRIDLDNYYIGCREFDKETFQQVLKAAGVKVKKNG